MNQLMVVIFLLVSEGTFAQCAVSQQKGSHSTTYITKFETAYTNKDLENGILEYQLRSVLNIEDKGGEDYYILECLYVTSGTYNQQEIVPRKIAVNFPDRKAIFIQALKEEDVPNLKNGTVGRIFSYEITTELLGVLKMHSLKSITFLDIRTKAMIDASTYKDLLKEQLDCLIVRSSKQ